MRNLKTLWAATGAVLALSGAMVASPVAIAGDVLPDESQCKKERPAEHAGWCAAVVRQAGNCIACHQIITQGWPESLPGAGNIAPPLVAMKARFPDRAKLHAQIWDATVANPHSAMPPYGRTQLLSESEIDAVVDWLLTL